MVFEKNALSYSSTKRSAKLSVEVKTKEGVVGVVMQLEADWDLWNLHMHCRLKAMCNSFSLFIGLESIKHF